MKQKRMRILLSLLLCFVFTLFTVDVKAETSITSSKIGYQDGYSYELWKDSGDTSMTLGSGGTFSCEWSNIGNALFRRGMRFDDTKTQEQLGNISVEYDCDYQPSGNSYLCVYGWTTSPLIEYYIVDSWGSWRPPGASSKGTITVDGATYDIYETKRVNQPSIIGNATFKQFWSVRTSKRTSGTISVSDHFKEWDKAGMQMGKMHEVAFTIEGYRSSGSAVVNTNKITVGGTPTPSATPTEAPTPTPSIAPTEVPTPTLTPTPTPISSKSIKMQCEKMTLQGSKVKKISSPFSGVALRSKKDLVKYKQKFTGSTDSFTLRGCSNSSKTAKVDLIIGGKKKGTFNLKGKSPKVYTLKNITHKTGNQEIKLVFTPSNDKCDAYLDYLMIKGK